MDTEKEITIWRKNDLIISIDNVKKIKVKVPSLHEFDRYPIDKEIEGLERGVYCLMNQNRVFYIGKSIQINKRMKTHKRRFILDSYLFYPVYNKLKLAIIERILIIQNKPIMNIEIEGWTK